jgi:hypothetical protein
MISIVSSTRDHEVVWPPYGAFFLQFLAQFFLFELERFGEQRIIIMTGRHPPSPPRVAGHSEAQSAI